MPMPFFEDGERYGTMRTATSISGILLLFLLRSATPLLAFAPNAVHQRERRWIPAGLRFRPRGPSSLSSSSSSDGGSSSLDDLRRILEAAWNMETMGHVPTSALGAAEAAVASLTTALERQSDDNGKSENAATDSRIYLIDILLPQYDITAGTNLYDEVLAVEFCIALANLLPSGKSEILVRDGKVLKTVQRILNAREGSSSTTGSTTSATTTTTAPLPPTAKETQERQTPSPPEPEFFDDFADFGAGGDAPIEKETASETRPTVENTEKDSLVDEPVPMESSSSTGSSSSDGDSIENFREMLLLSWEATVDPEVLREEERLDEVTKADSSIPIVEHEETPDTTAVEKRYRLASFLGDATISKGTDMVDDVMIAVKAHALPHDDEETIIVLSAMTMPELYAVRALVGKYKDSKTIILVNCKLDPFPQELLRAQTVYSILPLIARGRTSPSASSGSGTSNNANASPKVVVLRRYPRDWEVYVDVGNGFDLAASVPASSAGARRGPSMEWISSAVKRYLQNKVL